MSGLSLSKQRALLALVERGSVSRAADECKLSRQTLYRWLREPEFSSALRDASGSQVEQASRRLTALMMRAVDELELLLDSRSEHTRRLTADSILSHALRLRELVELESRVSELERKLEV